MKQAVASADELVAHLERAAEWHLLAQLFAYPDAGWRRRFELLCGSLRGAAMLELARRAAREVCPELWMRLFGPAGPVRIRAVSFDGGLQPGYLLAELAAFYEAFAYVAPPGSAPDDFPALLDFAAWLEMKLAYACMLEDVQAAEVTNRALETFLSRFLSAGAWRVYRQLEGLGPDFLVEAARLAAERSGAEPVGLGREPDLWPDGSPLEDLSCGGAGDFVPVKPIKKVR